MPSGQYSSTLISSPILQFLSHAFRMVWIISRYYSDDQKMGSLFTSIGREIGDRVEGSIDLKQLFKVAPSDAVDLLNTCKDVLDQWYAQYMFVREKIEVSGRDARWEFPKQLLFARTNYMIEICVDLIKIVEIVDDFIKFLGPDLKSVTGDIHGIERMVQRVKDMFEPIAMVDFNIFE